MFKRSFSVFLIFALAFSNTAYAAQAAFSCKTLKEIKDAPDDPRWTEGDWYDLESRYAMIYACIRKNKKLAPTAENWRHIRKKIRKKFHQQITRETPLTKESDINAVLRYDGFVWGINSLYKDISWRRKCFSVYTGEEKPCNSKEAQTSEESLKELDERSAQLLQVQPIQKDFPVSATIQKENLSLAISAKYEQEKEDFKRIDAFIGGIADARNSPPNKQTEAEIKYINRIYQDIKDGKDISKLVSRVAERNEEVSDSFVIALFILYAEQKGIKKENISKYLSHSSFIVAHAAARSLALNSADTQNKQAKVTRNTPAGKFRLTKQERRKIFDNFQDAIYQLDIEENSSHRELFNNLKKLAERVYTNPKFSVKAKTTRSSNENFAFGVIVLTMPSAEMAFFNTGMAAEAVISNSGRAVESALSNIGSAMGSAISNVGSTAVLSLGTAVTGSALILYTIVDELEKEHAPINGIMYDYDKLVTTPEALVSADAVTTARVQQAVAVSWATTYQGYGTQAASRTAEREGPPTCIEKQHPEIICGNIRLGDIRNYISQDFDFTKKLKQNLRDVGIVATKSTPISSLLQDPRLGAEFRRVLNLINKECNQYSNSKDPNNPHSAHVKARKNPDGTLIPEVEISILADQFPIADLLGGEILDFACKNIHNLRDIFDMENGSVLRNTDHERKNGHFHFEQHRGQYICNHAIFFDTQNLGEGSFVEQMEALCANR